MDGGCRALGRCHGQTYVRFAPLFGHQYSHVWIDFRGIRDAYMRGKGIDYFENTPRHARAARLRHRQPDGWRGYGERAVGADRLRRPGRRDAARSTAASRSSAPTPRAAPPTERIDDGTLAPTAAGGSMPFAPEIVIPALREMRERYGDPCTTLRLPRRLQSHASPTPPCGCSTAVVPGVGWFDTDYLGIDQGPIVAMIENHRSGLVWERDARESARRRAASSAPASPAAGSPRLSRSVCSRLARCPLRDGVACGRVRDGRETIRFWAMGREGEVVAELIRDFEREHPGIRVEVQQIPWTAAHEKLLTAHVGGATPDVAQLGNTWIPEFVALGALEPLDAGSPRSRIVRRTIIPGIWATNVIDGGLYGVPWYVDTRVLFYRSDLLARAGLRRAAAHWAEWLRAMRAIKRAAARTATRSSCRSTSGRSPARARAPAGAAAARATAAASAPSAEPASAARSSSTSSSSATAGAAGPNTQIANVYQEFARGYFAMYITGPWNIGEFQAPAAARAAGRLGDRAAARARRARRRVDRRRALEPGDLPSSEHQGRGLALIEFLSRPDVQLRFYELTGDLPARRSAWNDPALAGDRYARAFRDQLERVARRRWCPSGSGSPADARRGGRAGGARASQRRSLRAALDADVDRILEKRRWIAGGRGRRA